VLTAAAASVVQRTVLQFFADQGADACGGSLSRMIRPVAFAELLLRRVGRLLDLVIRKVRHARDEVLICCTMSWSSLLVFAIFSSPAGAIGGVRQATLNGKFPKR